LTLDRIFNSVVVKVAEHLSASYGDKAFKVARLAQLTGKRWPVVGKKLHDDYPYIEAEVISSGIKLAFHDADTDTDTDSDSDSDSPDMPTFLRPIRPNARFPREDVRVGGGVGVVKFQLN